MKLYQDLLFAKKCGKKRLAILLDPEKIEVNLISDLCKKINQSPATHIFVGGSTYPDSNRDSKLDEIILELKKYLNLPIVLFPGNPSQISNQADGILFLSLLSGRNPDYLIEYQVNAVPILKKTNLEVISTGYILIDGGKETAVQKVTNTKPLDTKNHTHILHTAQAGEFIGNQLIYLEAGSGAKYAVPTEIVKLVSENCKIPIIVGGGIRSKSEIQAVFNAGADLVVIGTAFENDDDFFNL